MCQRPTITLVREYAGCSNGMCVLLLVGQQHKDEIFCNATVYFT
jgi:hypothetical protein